jgi:hypothetical protein
MRLNTLYLTGALTVLAIPLSAGAQPAQSTEPGQLNSQVTTDVQQMTPAEETPAAPVGVGRKQVRQAQPMASRALRTA